MASTLFRRKSPPNRAGRKIYAVLLLSFLPSLACLISGTSSTDIQATADALEQSTLATAAAQSAGKDQDSPDAIATAQARATDQAIQIQATADALSNLSKQEIEATRAAFSGAFDELKTYGVEPESGRPAWVHPPVALSLDGYMVTDYANQFLGTVAADFVMASDITWNTQFGTSGCGFALRNNGAEGNFDQYLVIATRGGSGRVGFALMANGEVLNTRDFYAYGLDPAFNFRNDTTNRLAVVMQGPEVRIYTNGTQIASFNVNDPPKRPFIPPAPTPPPDIENNPEAAVAYETAKNEYDQIVRQINAEFKQREQQFQQSDIEFEKGFVAMVALSESGKTNCRFENTWLFIIED